MKSIVFDRKAHTFSFDAAGVLSRHKLIFTRRIRNSADGVPFGSGTVGAICHHLNDGIRFQINQVDGSPQTQIAGGHIFLCSEALRGSVKTVLDLYNGAVKMEYANGTRLTFSAGEKSPVIAVRVQGCSSAVYRFGLKIWKKIPHNYPHKFFSYLNDYSAWENYDIVGGRNWFGIEKRGSDVAKDPSISDSEERFGFITAVGTDSAFVRISEKTAQVTGDFTLYVAHPARFSAFDTEKFYTQMPRFEDFFQKNIEFWHSYWNKSLHIYSSKTSDYLENMYYISQYLFACGMGGKMPMHFTTGVFRSGGDAGLNWAPAYWWYNERCLYAGMLQSGHWENVIPLLSLYWDNRKRFARDTRKKYPFSEGFTVPETVSWCGSRYWTDGVDLVENIHASALEIALLMYRLWRFTGESVWKERFVEFGTGAADFYRTVLLEKSKDGKYFIPAGRSNARESFIGIENPVCDLAGIKKVFPLLSECTGNSIYDEIAKHLCSFPVGKFPERFLSGEKEETFLRRNADEPTLELLWPFDVYSEGKEWERLFYNYEYRSGRNEVLHYISWDNSAIWAACLGMGDEVYNFNRKNIMLTQKYANGLGTDGNCVYEYNGNLIHSMNLSYLQSHDGVLIVFPAVPKNIGDFSSVFTLWEEGGFCVSSEYDVSEYCAKFVHIYSARGEKCRLKNPWGRCAEVVEEESGQKIFSGNENILEFGTKAGRHYWIAPEGEQFVFQKMLLPEAGCKKLYDGEKKVRLGN